MGLNEPCSVSKATVLAADITEFDVFTTGNDCVVLLMER